MFALLIFSCGVRPIGQLAPQLSPPPSEYDFGKIPVLNEKKLEVPVISVGRVDLNVTNIKLAKDDGVFSIAMKPSDKLGPGITENIVIAFVPPKELAYTNTLSFETDDAQFPRVEVQLKGAGSTRAAAQVMPAMIEFGRVSECGSAVQQLTISSTGSADLIVTEIGFTENTAPGFAFVGSTRTPATVKTVGANGLMGQIQLTIRYVAAAGTTGDITGAVRLKTTDPDQPTIDVPLHALINRAPVAAIAPLGNGAPGITMSLDGTGSMDPDNNTPLTYKWTLRSKPLTSTSTIAAGETANASLRLDPGVPGAYEVQLDVTDALGAKSCQPAKATIVAAPAEKLLIELFWDNAVTDLDLHVLRTPQSNYYAPPDDCYYQNRMPDWGVAGDANDDPKLIRDALTGYGPETFGYVNPIDTTYRVVVGFENSHLAAMPASRATVRVYQYGVLKAETSKTLTRPGELWSVMEVTWPSGAVQVLP